MSGKEGQAGTEVEVTPEMIRAGVDALREWIPHDQDRYSGDDGRAVRDAFLAMRAAALASEQTLFRGRLLPDGMTAEQAKVAIDAILDWEGSHRLPEELAADLFKCFAVVR